MDKSTYEVRLARWTELVKSASERPRGVLLKDWLDDNGISRDQFFYWQRKVRRNAYNSLVSEQTENTLVPSVSFAEVPLAMKTPPVMPAPACSSTVGAILRTNAATIEISNSASPELIAVLLKVIAHA